MTDISPEIQKRIDAWLSGSYDQATKEEIQRLLKENPKSLSDAFYKDLSFGTGGMRGLMGIGTNRMNIYTISRATQGLANYLKKGASVFIGYDVRNSSREFAVQTARILAANDIKVFLTKNVCPTPMVSYGCRHFQTQAAVMITASHNPPEYNGYKVYGEDGGQITFPEDQLLIDEVNKGSNLPKLAPVDSPLIVHVGNEIDPLYLEEIKKLQLTPQFTKVKVVYTPLHGTGMRIIPKALRNWGYEDLYILDQQSAYDGNFSNAKSPNPEEPRALVMGTEKLKEEDADLLIATDPDADRIGVVSKGPYRLTGNQVACLLLDHICTSMQLPANAAVVKTIVTTELFAKIAKAHRASCINVLTGFKYIGEKIGKWEKDKENTFIFGAEESCGYLFGDYVRDKDAISSACIITEVAAKAKAAHKTLHDLLLDLYKKYGVHLEHLISLKFPDSEESFQKIQKKMETLRKNPPSNICGKMVIKVEDFLQGSDLFPSSNVVRMFLEDETKIVVRPSGTEPKIKIYIEVTAPISHDIDGNIDKCKERIEAICSSLEKAFK
jgi:phosphomannomutase